MQKLIKVYLRHIKRSQISFIINMIGLSTGLACTFLIYLWVKDEMNVDKFHINDNRLAQIMLWYQVNGTSDVTTPNTPGLLADALSKSLPEIEGAVAVANSIRMNTISIGKEGFKAKGIYASEDFFKLFSFDLIEGSEKMALADKSNIIISRELALKLFGTTRGVVGSSVEFDKKDQFSVSGIFNNVEPNSSIKFDFVLQLPLFQQHTGIEIGWGENIASTYLLLNEKSNIADINTKILDLQRSQGQDVSKMKFFARKFSDGYLYGNYENGQVVGGRIDYVKLFSVIGLIILVIACINFISLSTAMASNRMKEVSVKKILGANRKAIIFQHIGESIILAFLALLVSLVMVIFILPSFNALSDKQISLRLSPDTILVFLAITFVTGILSGLYPAFYISKFNSGNMLRDKPGTSSAGQWIRKGLVVMQFTISVILIVTTLVVYNQFSMIQNRNLGYNKDNVVYFDVDQEDITHRESFMAEVKNVPGIRNVSSIFAMTTKSGFFGDDGKTGRINWPGKDADEMIVMNYRIVDYDLIELLGMEIKQGRSFSRKFDSKVPEVIFNEAAIKAMGLKGDPIGAKVEIWQIQREIIGVVKDFYFESIQAGAVKPMFLIRDPNELNTFMVGVTGENLNETIDEIGAVHAKFYPGYPFTYRFMDQDFQNLYSAEKKMSVLSQYFAGLAILISCLGLFGLTAFTVNQRRKEISIRKVLGSSGPQVAFLLFRDVSKLVIVSLLIGLPVGYIVASNWLSGFAVRIDLDPWIFIAAGGLSFALMMVASGFQVIKILLINPAESLRTE